jgi:pimeloyl-ACP methyl ester carboxylesterase
LRIARPREVGILDVGTASLRVAVQGGGRPLLLVSGIGGSLDMWDPFEPHLQGFQTITFDPPGTGGSSPVRFPVGIGEVADLAAGVLAALGREQVDVLGYSWGGAVAQELASRHPQIVRRLVLCATTCGLGGPPGTPAALAAFVNPWHFLAARAQSHNGHPHNLAGYAGQLCAIATWTSLPWLHELSTPTLIVAGEVDRVVPVANARLLASRIPGSRLHIIPRAGHLLLLNQPQEVAPVIREFLLTPEPAVARRRRVLRLLHHSGASRRGSTSLVKDKGPRPEPVAVDPHGVKCDHLEDWRAAPVDRVRLASPPPAGR